MAEGRVSSMNNPGYAGEGARCRSGAGHPGTRPGALQGSPLGHRPRRVADRQRRGCAARSSPAARTSRPRSAVDTGVQLVLPHFPWCRRSCRVQQTRLEEFEACSAIDRALQHFDPADLSLDRAREVTSAAFMASKSRRRLAAKRQNNVWAAAALKAEGHEFVPELAGVAASLAPAPFEKCFEWVENALTGGLLPKRRLAEPQPAMDGLAISPQLSGDARDRRAKATQPRGLLVAPLATFPGDGAGLLDLGRARHRRSSWRG